jgi:hypothetical protein
MKEHNWVLISRKVSTSVWQCSNCKLKASTVSNVEFSENKILIYYWPDWSPNDLEEAVKEIKTNGFYKTCLSKDERMIKDIIE